MNNMLKPFMFILITISAVLFVSACGSGDEGVENATLTDENWEEVQIAGKEKPTVFFHFTGIG